MAVHRLDGHHHPHLLRILHNRPQMINKNTQRLLRMAFRRKGIGAVGRSRLRAHHPASQPGSETDMGHIAPRNPGNPLFVRIRQIQVAAQHGNIHLIFGKEIFQVHSQSRRQRFILGGEFADHLGEGQVPAGKSQTVDLRNPFFQRKLRQIMYSYSQLHLIAPFLFFHPAVLTVFSGRNLLTFTPLFCNASFPLY